MPDNDFLNQFSNSGKPDSFKEEERIPVTKERKPLNIKLLIILLALLLLLLVLGYFLFLAPKIAMPNFVGRTKSEVAAWVKQQGIEASGIVFSEEHDFDSAADTILTQSIPEGKKVRKDVKLNFTLSLGPDPDEKINVPDLESMTKQEIQDWIASNKLEKAKISTSFNEEVPENEVIDYSFTGCEEAEFTRGCNLKINVSKGKAPAGKVTVEDFEKKIYETAEAWGKQKNININKVEQYSDKVDLGYIISQSIASGKTIDEGETLTVVVSKGKATYMPNMVGWNTKKEMDSWQRKNPSILIIANERYSEKPENIVLKQNVSPGTLIDNESYVEVEVSLGNIVHVEGSFIGSQYHDAGGLHDWKDEQNRKGANIDVNRIMEFSDTVCPGCIIRHDNAVEVGGTLNAWFSRGKNILLFDSDVTYFEKGEEKTNMVRWKDIVKGNGVREEEARALAKLNEVTYEIIYSYAEGKSNGDVIRAYRNDGLELAAGVYCPQDNTVWIVVHDDLAKE